MSESHPDWQVGAPVETQSTAVDAQLAEIATFRRENKSDYFRDDAMQARELELLDAKENGPAPVAAPENVMHPSDVIPASAFVSPEDLDLKTAPALDVAKAVLAEDASWENTVAGFTQQLSTTAQNVLVAEMAGGPVDDAQPLTPDEIVQFTSNRARRELWDEWGSDAPEKAAMAFARIDRLEGNLPEHEVETFVALFKALPPAAFKEAVRQLAGG